MKTLLLVCLLLLALAAPALADVVTVQDGWTVVYHITGEPSSRWFGVGTYFILFPASATYGVVYLEYLNEALGHQSTRLLGFLGQVPLPDGFPNLTYECPTVSNVPGPNTSGCAALQIFVIPPPPPVVQAPVPLASCGPRPTRPHSYVIALGGLPEATDIIGPFATPALAQRFAQKHCQGDYSIEPLTR